MDKLPKAVLFDMDGVIVHSEPLIKQGLINMFAEQGVTITANDLTPFTGTGEIYCISEVARMNNCQLDPYKARQRSYAIYYELIKDKLKPLPGMLNFLEKCCSLGKKTAVASNSELEKLYANFDAIDLSHDLFDAFVTGSEVENKKPAPDIFLLAAEKLGVEPNQCLVIEDAKTGIQAAHAAGAKCLCMTTTFPADELKEADWIADDFTNLPSEILQW